MDLKNKLNNLPHIYYLNLDNRYDRKEYMEKQFFHWGIQNYTRVSTSKYLASKSSEWSNLVVGNIKNIPAYVVGTAISHFETIKTWLNTTNDEYVILMEDDYDLNLIRYWHFDWDYLMTRLPYDWDCIQLGFETKDYVPFFLHPKTRGSFFGPVLINRNYAHKILDLHTVGEKYCLDRSVCDLTFKDCSITVDYFIGHTGRTYCLPLITTNTDFGSTEYDVKIDRKHHEVCKKIYYWWWINKRNDFTLDEFFTYGKHNDQQMTILVDC